MKISTLAVLGVAALALSRGGFTAATPATTGAPVVVEKKDGLLFTNYGRTPGDYQSTDPLAGLNIAGIPTELSAAGQAVQAQVNSYLGLEGNNADFFSKALSVAPSDLAKGYAAARQYGNDDTAAYLRNQIDTYFAQNYRLSPLWTYG